MRPYQHEAVTQILSQWGKPCESALPRAWGARIQPALVAMATGTGKTEIGLGVLQSEFLAGTLQRALIISHTTELVSQPVDRVCDGWPGLPIPGIVRAEIDDVGAQIISASVQTLSSSNRLNKCLVHGMFTHVWIDEAHHVMAQTYRAILEKLFRANPELRLLGTTATPMRSDGQGLGVIFGERLAYQITIQDAINRLGAITPFRAYAAVLDGVEFDFSDVRTNAAGDYAPQLAGDILSLPSATKIIIDKWLDIASDRPTIAFTASVSQAHFLAQAFRDHGVDARAIDGSTPSETRKQIIGDFRDGKFQVLVGCAVFVEGFDAPIASCALIARPTQSDGSYIQMVGRCLRWYDKKCNTSDNVGHTDAIIIDIVPRGARNLSLATGLMGAPKIVRAARERASAQSIIMPNLFGVDADSDSVFLELMDLFGNSELAWLYGDGIASVSIAGGRDSGKSIAIAIVMGDDKRLRQADEIRAAGKWCSTYDAAYHAISYRVYLIEQNKAEIHGAFSTFEQASLLANDLHKLFGENALAAREKQWRRGLPSDKQRQYAQRLGVWQSGMNRGRCAAAITHKIAIKALDRIGVVRPTCR